MGKIKENKGEHAGAEIRKAISKAKESSESPIKRKKQEAGQMIIPEEVDEYLLNIDGMELQLTNLNKIFFPQDDLTKRDIFNYYIKVSPYILPYLRDRPNVMHRQINGIDKENTFHQSVEGLRRNWKGELPEWIETVPVFTETYKREVPYYLVNNLPQLLFLVQLGCIEINPWHSRKQSLDHPDYIVLDFDPTDIAFSAVIETAQAAKEVIDEAGLTGFLKTSGKSGLHIYLPIRGFETEEVYSMAQIICKLIHEKLPTITSLERMTAKRKGKVYCDWHQNAWSRPLAAPYCIRSVPLAPVSTPLKWEELNKKLNPTIWTIRTIFDRIERVGDLFKGVITE